ncbi:MAG: polyprenyl synthetase family protein [Actinomycetia bacterium]|nr:polyprenyl synthetase family protein [Actinomycetes bacterium]
MSLGPCPQTLQDYRTLIDGELERFIRPERNMPEEYGLALRAAVTSPGKRIRPTITLLMCQASGGCLTSALRTAVSIELLHAATLIYDDIVDGDLSRRGEPSLHARFGNDLAMMVAGLITTRALFPIIENHGLARATLETMNDVGIGEILDIKGEVSTREDYFSLVGRKTAALFQLSAEAGAMCAEATVDHRMLCGAYGLNVGIMFQIRDDVLDVTGNMADRDESVNSDVINCRPSIVSILAGESLKVAPLDLSTALGALGSDESTARLQRACDSAMNLGRHYADRAEALLIKFRPTRHRELLQEVLQLAMKRQC